MTIKSTLKSWPVSGQFVVDDLERVNGGDDGGLRPDQPGFCEQSYFDVGVSGTLADPYSSAVNGDASQTMTSTGCISSTPDIRCLEPSVEDGGALRSQMSVRICLRVRERRDVDLTLDKGMLSAGWHAHILDAPGKFYVLADGHNQPRRARAYLVTDDDVSATVAQHATTRPNLDPLSADAIDRDAEPDHDVIDGEVIEKPTRTDPLDSAARRTRQRPVRTRTHATDRNEAHMDLRPTTGPRQRRPRPTGRPRTLASYRGAPPCRLTRVVRVRADNRPVTFRAERRHAISNRGRPTIVDSVVVNPRQARKLLTAVTYVGRRGKTTRGARLYAFFACLYFAALRPGEALGLRLQDCHLPKTGWAR